MAIPTTLAKGDTLESPDGRRFAVDLVVETKVLLLRTDRRHREQRRVWKNRAEVETWRITVDAAGATR